jgi:hypothetical protein
MRHRSSASVTPRDLESLVTVSVRGVLNQAVRDGHDPTAVRRLLVPQLETAFRARAGDVSYLAQGIQDIGPVARRLVVEQLMPAASLEDAVSIWGGVGRALVAAGTPSDVHRHLPTVIARLSREPEPGVHEAAYIGDVARDRLASIPPRYQSGLWQALRNPVPTTDRPWSVAEVIAGRILFEAHDDGPAAVRWASHLVQGHEPYHALKPVTELTVRMRFGSALPWLAAIATKAPERIRDDPALFEPLISTALTGVISGPDGVRVLPGDQARAAEIMGCLTRSVA